MVDHQKLKRSNGDVLLNSRLRIISLGMCASYSVEIEIKVDFKYAIYKFHCIFIAGFTYTDLSVLIIRHGLSGFIVI